MHTEIVPLVHEMIMREGYHNKSIDAVIAALEDFNLNLE